MALNSDIIQWMEYSLTILFLFPSAVFPDQGFDYWKYREWENSEMVPTRLLELMKTYYIDADIRIIDMNPMRFMYEETPYYELGYVISEIIERYRKMVESAKRPEEFISDEVYSTVKRTELIQKLYFETYHLVNMLHEIPRKYSYMEEFRDMLEPSDKDDIEKRERWIKEQNRMRKLREREERKRLKQLRELYMKLKMKNYVNYEKKPYNLWWPINYGWEINYYW